MINKYIQNPKYVQAMQIIDEPGIKEELDGFTGQVSELSYSEYMLGGEQKRTVCFEVPTDIGNIKLYEGSWVIKHQDGKIRINPPEMFEKSFEKVDG